MTIHETKITARTKPLFDELNYVCEMDTAFRYGLGILRSIVMANDIDNPYLDAVGAALAQFDMAHDLYKEWDKKSRHPRAMAHSATLDGENALNAEPVALDEATCRHLERLIKESRTNSKAAKRKAKI